MLPLYRRLTGAERGESERREEERWVEGVGDRGEEQQRRDAAVKRAWLSAASSSSSSSPPLRLWVYSGDTDGIVPVLGTRRWVEGLGLPVSSPNGGNGSANSNSNSASASGGGGGGGNGNGNGNGNGGGGGNGNGNDGAWRSWSDAAGQVGGRRVDYVGGLTFSTVRGAGHMVPYDQPQRAQELLRMFLDEGEEVARGNGDEGEKQPQEQQQV